MAWAYIDGGGAGAAPPNRPRNFRSVEVPNIGKDTWHHTLLLYILENRFSVTGTSLEWFRSYLTDRTQIFTAGLTSTSPLSLVFGVPQGPDLGPVEFIAVNAMNMQKSAFGASPPRRLWRYGPPNWNPAYATVPCKFFPAVFEIYTGG